MLPGYALAMQGTQIHVAAWTGLDPDPAPAAPVGLWPRQTLLSRAFASQAGAYVILSAAINRRADYPVEFQEAVQFDHDGGSCIIDPRGEIIAGPVKNDETILTATGSLDLVRSVKAVIDIGGHYSRPDVFQFSVDRGARQDTCRVPCDHIPVRSWPLFRARELMRDVIESFEREQTS